MLHRNDGTAPHKSFRLVGGSDEDAIRLATKLRSLYGHIIPVERKIDPVIEEEARACGIEIYWWHSKGCRIVEGPFTRTKGAVASC